MRVLFDLTQIQYSAHCGVFKYATRIIDGWKANGVTDVCILTNDTFGAECRNRWPNYPIKTIAIPMTGYLRRGVIAAFRRKIAIDQSGCDVAFVPMFEPLFFFVPSIPVVMTVHDLQAYKVFTGKLWWYNALGFPWQLLRSRKIIPITHYTESQLKSHWYYKPSKGVVVHNPVAFDESRYEPVVNYPYLLCVNTIVDYKNQMTLVRAFHRIADKIEHKLVLVGNEIPDYWEAIKGFIDKHGLSDRVVHLKNIREEDLVSLYQHASLFVTPSTMEGFGQTPIEAAIYGCPVISSRCAALPETTLGIVDYYEPVMSDESLAMKIMEVLEREQDLKHYSEVAQQFRKEYDCLSQSMKIYNQVISV